MEEARCPQYSTYESSGCPFFQDELIQADSHGGPGLSPRVTNTGCIARAAATGPGSLCQLVPDLSDSAAHPHLCHEGHQQWHEVLIRPLAPHPTEGVSDSSNSVMPQSHLQSESQMSCLSSCHLCLRTDIDRPYDWHLKFVYVSVVAMCCYTVYIIRVFLLKACPCLNFKQGFTWIEMGHNYPKSGCTQWHICYSSASVENIMALT